MKTVAIVCVLVYVIWSVDSKATTDGSEDWKVKIQDDEDLNQQLADLKSTQELIPQKALRVFQKNLCAENVTLEMDPTGSDHFIVKRSALLGCSVHCGWSGCSLRCSF